MKFTRVRGNLYEVLTTICTGQDPISSECDQTLCNIVKITETTLSTSVTTFRSSYQCYVARCALSEVSLHIHKVSGAGSACHHIAAILQNLLY
jgi:hypothetical protein